MSNVVHVCVLSRARRGAYVAGRMHIHPWGILYYSPDYHPCSALGFTKAEPREGDNQGRTKTAPGAEQAHHTGGHGGTQH